MSNAPSPVLPPFKVGITIDDAWALPTADTFTSSHLRDGDFVELEANTKGVFAGGSFVVPRGTLGNVTEAKAQRAKRRSDASSHFFAIVEVIVEGCPGLIQVPHAALRVRTQPMPRPDAIRRGH